MGSGRRGVRLRAVALLAAALLASACAGPEPYRTLAQAGSSYAEATEQALTSYRATYLDGRSEQWLANEAEGAAAPDAAFTLQACAPTRGPGADRRAGAPLLFARGQCQDIRIITAVARLTAHAKLLGRYFEAMEELAAHDAPARAGAAAKRIADGLTGIGETLNRTVPGQIAALPPIFQAGVGLMQRAALQNELRERGETIRRELRIQAKVLRWLDAEMKAEQANLWRLQYRRRIAVPLETRQAAAAGDRWVADRRALLLQTDQSSGVQNAEKALASLTEAYETLLRGGDADQQLGQLIADVNLMLDVVEPFVARQ